MITIGCEGVFPALMIEINEDGSLDLESTARHIEACREAGIRGIVMLGALGENSSLSAEEKRAVLRAAVETVDGRVRGSQNWVDRRTAGTIRTAAEELNNPNGYNDCQITRTEEVGQ